jgi:hypothetical protein
VGVSGSAVGREVLRGGSIFLLLMAVDDTLIVNFTIGCSWLLNRDNY